MPDDHDDFQLAVLHYRLQFPTLLSLGTGAPPALWRAEYDRVADSGLSATLVTSTGSEGTSVGASRNFDQKVLLRALHARRAELDTAYLPYAPAAVDPRPGRPMGITVRLGP